jgi:hypothetical protein
MTRDNTMHLLEAVLKVEGGPAPLSASVYTVGAPRDEMPNFPAREGSYGVRIDSSSVGAKQLVSLLALAVGANAELCVVSDRLVIR